MVILNDHGTIPLPSLDKLNGFKRRLREAMRRSVVEGGNIIYPLLPPTTVTVQVSFFILGEGRRVVLVSYHPKKIKWRNT